MGYGSYYEGKWLLKEGTYLGEATGFPIVACAIEGATYDIYEHYKELKIWLLDIRKLR